MKLFLAIAVVALTLSACSSSSTNNLLGIPWGGTKADVTDMMKTIEGATLEADTSNVMGSALVYMGGNFKGFPVTNWKFRFHNNRLLFSHVVFRVDSMQLSSGIFDKVCNAIGEEYGKPVRSGRLNSETTGMKLTNEEEDLLHQLVGQTNNPYEVWGIGNDRLEYIVSCTLFYEYLDVTYTDRSLLDEFLKAMQ